MGLRARKIDMLSGPLGPGILRFAFPLVCTNLLQALFNLADMAVVGRFTGSAALGAVGSTTTLLWLTTGILTGLAGGVRSVTAFHFGAKNGAKVRETVRTAFSLCLAAGLLLLLYGLSLGASTLRLLDTRPDLLADASLYLRIYLLGSPALALYNWGNAVPGASGDTVRPLRILTVAGGLNVLLNLFFVIVLRLGVVGVALASIISQYISAFWVFRLLREGEQPLLDLRLPGISGPTARRILAIGLPAAAQNVCFHIANLSVQTAVNSFESAVVEGNAAAVNGDCLIFDVMAAFYATCTSFAAQNFGAGKPERVRRSFYLTTVFSTGIALFLGILAILFREPFLSLFTDDPRVAAFGAVRMQIMGLSIFISGFMDNSVAFAQGLGKSFVPTLIVMCGSVVYRIVWVHTVFARVGTLPSLYLVFPTAWALTSVALWIYLRSLMRRMLLPKTA